MLRFYLSVFLIIFFHFTSCTKIEDQNIILLDSHTNDNINSISGINTIRAVGGRAWNSGVVLEFENNEFEIIENNKKPRSHQRARLWIQLWSTYH